MGAKDSKRSCIIYEDAVKRISDAELKRICETFKRLTNGGQLLSRTNFIQNVLGDGVPLAVAERLYVACGGGVRGIALRDLICGLVLLTKGSEEEKIKFLWTLYCNDSGTHITRNEFQSALQIEGTLPPPDAGGGNNGGSNNINKPNLFWDRTIISLFGVGQDRCNFDDFRAWIIYNKDATILTKWLLSNSRVSLSSEVETPTFYQTLAGVTHLEEQDICELEKCFWSLQSSSVTGHLDFNCLKTLVCPPVPLKACQGLFLALDVNRDEHVDFKELCCGISAACRGPMAERMKFCFKIFDMDSDGYLNKDEVNSMNHTLLFIAKENKIVYGQQVLNDDMLMNQNDQKDVNDIVIHKKTLEKLQEKLDESGGLTQEDFLVWSVENNSLLAPLLELLFQVCHVSLGLKPHCRHNEYEIVMGWLEREEKRGFHVGQFWYLISIDWWQQWLNYTTSPKTNFDHCNCRHTPESRMQIEEGIVCDESLLSNTTDYTTSNISNEFNSNSMESMGDLLSKGDSCSIASSSGVSSSSGTCSKKFLGIPGPIDNSNLVEDPLYKVPTLTGEGGRLKRDTPLVQHRDFVLVPDSLWKALSLWYGGPLPLPRQVIKPPGRSEVELEFYPVNLRILRHQQMSQNANGNQQTWTSVVGGYGAAALSTAGLTNSNSPSSAQLQTPRRYLSNTATFSRLATIQQMTDFLCNRLNIKSDDARLWHLSKDNQPSLLDDDNATIQDLNINDADQILIEVRNKDLTWPEELGALVANGGLDVGLSVERRPTICLPPGATGLHNLGNTCFMNAALQAVSNTRPLTLYFQQDSQLTELNTSNPLGTKGAVARRYAELCRELWAGSTRSVAPLKLRYCVTKHAPHLGGGGQHDSQELLAWLLDALHEDLNRVTKKQYTELKDSGGRPDEIVAEEAWQQHLARDHSIITDLFYGQLKSKVTCQTCGHESVRFDPFNLLSLPLPMESYTLCEVLVIPLNGKCPVKYGLRLNSESKYIELKQQLEKLCNIESYRLLLAELQLCQIKTIISDDARINPITATQLYAYELPDIEATIASIENGDQETELTILESPLARSPEVSGGSALCMPNILCFKTKNESRLPNGITFKKSSISIHSTTKSVTSTEPTKCPNYLIAVHRKWTRQESYFLSQQKSKPNLFGLPLLLGCSRTTTCKNLYESVWNQVTRLLSPMPQSDQTNHATDCDDSLGYAFPFTLKTILQGGQICALCHWTEFCRGCTIPCNDEQYLFDFCNGCQYYMLVAIDWDHTALHLRYQSNREKLWLEHESVSICRKLHTEPIDLDYCLKAFTSEERLEAKYHCSSCQDKQPATKKLQIWRLPPILIVHLKRFDYVNSKWVKTQKVVNFPFKNFDPTAYLASIPQETILRHKHILEQPEKPDLENSTEKVIENILEETKLINVDDDDEDDDVVVNNIQENDVEKKSVSKAPACKSRNGRERLESTSLIKTPIIDEHLKDYHQHKLKVGQDPFDLKYQLYAVVCHSGMLNGGHYISYTCNPNGNWYCYNDSSCREVLTNTSGASVLNRLENRKITSNSGCTPLSRRKYLRKSSTSSGSGGGPVGENSLHASQNSLNGHSRGSVDSTATVTSSTTDQYDDLNFEEDLGRKLIKNSSPYTSNKSLNQLKCPYEDVQIPNIDTSTAYILFYERSGLDYKPYLPKITSINGNNNNNVPAVVELDENESELRKQLCSIQ